MGSGSVDHVSIPSSKNDYVTGRLQGTEFRRLYAVDGTCTISHAFFRTVGVLIYTYCEFDHDFLTFSIA